METRIHRLCPVGRRHTHRYTFPSGLWRTYVLASTDYDRYAGHNSGEGRNFRVRSLRCQCQSGPLLPVKRDLSSVVPPVSSTGTGHRYHVLQEASKPSVPIWVLRSGYSERWRGERVENCDEGSNGEILPVAGERSRTS